MKNSQDPAFAFVDNRSSSYEDNEVHYGLSKREYIAAKAMQGLLSAGEQNQPDMKGINERKAIAQYAVQIADALLQELEQPVVSTETEW